MVYDNLLRGSRKHLQACMKVLTQRGRLTCRTIDAVVAEVCAVLAAAWDLRTLGGVQS